MKRIVRIDIGTASENIPLLIITDAPILCIEHNLSTFSIKDALEFIAEKYYVRHLYDPLTDPADDADAIGWDERYDECGNKIE